MSYMKDIDEYTEQELVDEINRRRAMRAEGRCDYCYNLQGVPTNTEFPQYKGSDSCRFPERHRGEVAVAHDVIPVAAVEELARWRRWVQERQAHIAKEAEADAQRAR